MAISKTEKSKWPPPDFFYSTDASAGQIAREFENCLKSRVYFVKRYVHIFDKIRSQWVPFDLWPDQEKVLLALEKNKYMVIAKARQLGITWLVLAYDLYDFIFKPIHVPIYFSKGDSEVIELLDERLKGMYERLPYWMRAASIEIDNKHNFKISTGSHAKGLTPGGGRSFAGTRVYIDEADHIKDLSKLLTNCQPIVDDGGQLVIFSTVDKRRPKTAFKNIFRSAIGGGSDYGYAFLPWHSHPDRTRQWYEDTKKVFIEAHGSDDMMLQEFPGTWQEAFAPITYNKRIPPKWIERCYDPVEQIDLESVDAPYLPGLRLYEMPKEGTTYVIGCDTCEGNPTSDDSGFVVADQNGDQVAVLQGKFQPEVLAASLSKVSRFYHGAPAMVERNNHGHAVIMWLTDNTAVWVLAYPKDGRDGWLSNSVGKQLLYDAAAQQIKDGNTKIRDMECFNQLCNIEGDTLRAPEGEKDDMADCYALALAALHYPAALPQIRQL